MYERGKTGGLKRGGERKHVQGRPQISFNMPLQRIQLPSPQKCATESAQAPQKRKQIATALLYDSRELMSTLGVIERGRATKMRTSRLQNLARLVSFLPSFPSSFYKPPTTINNIIRG